jgi:redox-sensitive bicupin YhaK (pirin superfamily)
VIDIRPSASLFHADGGWFQARWHFSFDTYYDPQYMRFGTLRVFNDDRLVPGAIWPMHPHRDIEAITYVAEGTFEHADSMGNGGVLPAGSVQRATLGSGMMHSERNHSKTEPMRFIQMWIIPGRAGLPPSVEQRSFTADQRRHVLRPVLVAAPNFGGPDAPRDRDAVTVHQDAAVYASILDPGKSQTHRFRPGFGGYFFAVHGEAALSAPSHSGGVVDEGGAARIEGVAELAISARRGSAEVLLVEVRVG